MQNVSRNISAYCRFLSGSLCVRISRIMARNAAAAAFVIPSADADTASCKNIGISAIAITAYFPAGIFFTA